MYARPCTEVCSDRRLEGELSVAIGCCEQACTRRSVEGHHAEAWRLHLAGDHGDDGRPTLADVEKLLQPMSAPAKASTYNFTMF